MKTKFKSQVSCFSPGAFAAAAFQPSFASTRKRRETIPAACGVNAEHPHIPLCWGGLGGCRIAGAGRRGWVLCAATQRGLGTPQHRWHPARFPRSHREAPCPCTGSAGPGAAQGRMRSFMSCLAPACLRTASGVYRPTRTLLQTGGSCSWRRDAGGGFCDALRSWPCGRPEERSLVYPAVAFLAETPQLNSARGCTERSSLLAAAASVRVENSSPFRGRRTDVRAAKGRNVARILQPAKPGRFLSGSYFHCHILCW